MPPTTGKGQLVGGAGGRPSWHWGQPGTTVPPCPGGLHAGPPCGGAAASPPSSSVASRPPSRRAVVAPGEERVDGPDTAVPSPPPPPQLQPTTTTPRRRRWRRWHQCRRRWGGGKVPAGAYVPLVRVAGAGPQGWRGEVTIMMDCNRAGRCAIEYTPSLPPPQLRQWRQRSVPPPPLPAIKGKWPSGHLAQ